MILGKYQKVQYSDLGGKAQEAYNFQKASAILADYGFVTNLLKYDWLGADFLAQHIDGEWLKVQLKGRLTTKPEYEGKEIYIMFEDKNNAQWYLFPHDELTKYCRENYPDAVFTREGHSRPNLSRWETEWLKPYAINPRLESYVYESAEDHPDIISLVNKAYQFANDVCASINEDGKVSFLGQSYFRSFILKVAGEVGEQSRQGNS
jgi:hypothetical protein